ncbi:hypothetical protein O181_040353 [Austropuccinia psidii MF-1]|uniref:MoaB/Mog domain-containing protein n=1 Tax=Austropuccinia psidii MF-1 TaxID=1389203 RepID=A0A9Q3DH15_9BASI|nr:hypothetical protein [Austropuccinia psidii MF-1]
MSNTATDLINFSITPHPTFSPEILPVRTAACVVIGDEILNGKTLDTNSHQLASLLFGLGISLSKIEVIPDHEQTIINCVKRLISEKFDIIFTSGGIGPTHDDITYQSLAKVFDSSGELEYDQETIKRMEAFVRQRQGRPPTEEERTSRRRMALFPKKEAEIIFVEPHLWVPVVCLAKKLYILPGVPSLFQQLVQALLCNYIPLPPETEKPHRIMISTPLTESTIAPFLSALSKRVANENIKLGSYPNLVSRLVNVSIIGTDLDRLKRLAQEIEEEFKRLS